MPEFIETKDIDRLVFEKSKFKSDILYLFNWSIRGEVDPEFHLEENKPFLTLETDWNSLIENISRDR